MLICFPIRRVFVGAMIAAFFGDGDRAAGGASVDGGDDDDGGGGDGPLSVSDVLGWRAGTAGGTRFVGDDGVDDDALLVRDRWSATDASNATPDDDDEGGGSVVGSDGGGAPALDSGVGAPALDTTRNRISSDWSAALKMSCALTTKTLI